MRIGSLFLEIELEVFCSLLLHLVNMVFYQGPEPSCDHEIP